jgi:hypothetical protein
VLIKDSAEETSGGRAFEQTAAHDVGSILADGCIGQEHPL